MQLRQLRCPPAPLAGNDLISVRPGDRAHHQWLQQAFFTDRQRQFFEIFLGKAPPGIVGVGLNFFDRQGVGRRRPFEQPFFLRHIANQRGQPAPQPVFAPIFRGFDLGFFLCRCHVIFLFDDCA